MTNNMCKSYDVIYHEPTFSEKPFVIQITLFVIVVIGALIAIGALVVVLIKKKNNGKGGRPVAVAPTKYPHDDKDYDAFYKYMENGEIVFNAIVQLDIPRKYVVEQLEEIPTNKRIEIFQSIMDFLLEDRSMERDKLQNMFRISGPQKSIWAAQIVLCKYKNFGVLRRQLSSHISPYIYGDLAKSLVKYGKTDEGLSRLLKNLKGFVAKDVYNYIKNNAEKESIKLFECVMREIVKYNAHVKKDMGELYNLAELFAPNICEGIDNNIKLIGGKTIAEIVASRLVTLIQEYYISTDKKLVFY